MLCQGTVIKGSLSVNNHLDSCGYEFDSIYIVSACLAESEVKFLDLFQWVFGLEVYTNSRVCVSDFGRFQFSEMYPYSIFTFRSIDGFEVSLQYFTFFHLIFNSGDIDFFDPEERDFDFQVQSDFELVRSELVSFKDFFYFVGFGPDKVISSVEFSQFVQFMILATSRSGPNSAVIVILFRNLCFFPFMLKNWG